MVEASQVLICLNFY